MVIHLSEIYYIEEMWRKFVRFLKEKEKILTKVKKRKKKRKQSCWGKNKML